MQNVSIREKLLSSSNRLGTSLVVMMLLAVSIVVLTVSNHTLQELQSSAEENLITKGLLLIRNNQIALVNLVEENSFQAIDDIVASTVNGNAEIVYGIFMAPNRLAWSVHFEPNTPLSDQSDKPEKAQILEDPMSHWASSLEDPTYQTSTLVKVPSIEFATPVRSDGRIYGYIRYGLSKKKLLEQKDALTLKIRNIFFLALFVCTIISLSLLYWLRSAVRKQAQQLTDPIIALSKAANEISQGKYDNQITVTSDDEVGELAQNFETMRTTVKDYTDKLEEKVAERTQALEKAQRTAIENARKAGMAEIATGTLHNVGNLLNSALTPIDTSNLVLKKSKLKDFFKATSLLEKHEHDMKGFLITDPKGPQLFEYLVLISHQIQQEHHQLSTLTEQAYNNLRTIADTITTQQEYAKERHAAMEMLRLHPVIAESLRLCQGQIKHNDITIDNTVPLTAECYADYSKLMQIMVNLISNSIDAMRDSADRVLSFSCETDNDMLTLYVDDTGSGIPPEHAEAIFTYGFTTKETGNGFGLHSCANYMTEMGGKIYPISKPASEPTVNTRMVLILALSEKAGPLVASNNSHYKKDAC